MSNKQSGAVIIVVALAMFSLFTLLALCVDMGWLIIAKNQAQAATDAAALSAAAGLPKFRAGVPGAIPPQGDTSAIATLTAKFNGSANFDDTNSVIGLNPDINLSDVNILNELGVNVESSSDALVFGTASRVQVTKTYNVNHFFGKFIGRDSTPITVTSTAALGGPRCLNVELPIAIINQASDATQNLCNPSQCAVGEQTLNLKQDGEFDSANTLAYFNVEDTADANACRDIVSGGTQLGNICAGTALYLNNGVISSCGNDMERECLGQGSNPPKCNPTWDVYVPVINVNSLGTRNPNQNIPAEFAGFVKIAISAIGGSGAHRTVTFEVKCDPIPNSAGGGAFCLNSASRPALIQ